jgi:hypothetical protein
MLSRRSALALMSASAVAGPAAAQTVGTPERRLDTAIAVAGGREALNRCRTLRWTGVVRGVTPLGIRVDTTVTPFGYARSDTWLETEGPEKKRTLLIEGEQGWTIVNGEKKPMTPAMLLHERQQYALYGLMRLVTLEEPGVTLSVRMRSDGEGFTLDTRHPQAPAARLMFDRMARLEGAEYLVAHPETGAPVQETVVFENMKRRRVKGGMIRWPEKLRMFQNGKPYLELTFETFEAGEA